MENFGRYKVIAWKIFQLLMLLAPLTTMKENDNMNQEDTEKFITERLAHILMTEPDMIEKASDLFSLGLDSLSAIQLVIYIENKMQIKISPIALFENPTIESLTNYIINTTGTN